MWREKTGVSSGGVRQGEVRADEWACLVGRTDGMDCFFKRIYIHTYIEN